MSNTAQKRVPSPDERFDADLEDAATGREKTDAEITSRERRHRIIWAILQHRGKITFEDLERFVKLEGSQIRNVNRKSFYEDIEALQYIFGTKISGVKGADNSLTYVLQTSQRATTKQQRATVNNKQKAQVASLCAGVLLGTDETVGKVLIQPYSKSLIGKLRERQASSLAHRQCETLLHALHSLVWSQTQRRVALDTGTTVEIFARDFLAKLELPCGNLNRLHVCTNSRGIFNVLGDPSVPIKTIMVGGSQHPQTEAVVGWCAEKFLIATNLTFSICFIGATAVDTKHFTLGADQDHDAGIKNEFLNRSEIRVVVADSSKWGDGTCSSYSPFSGINDGSISLIITDTITEEHMDRINSRGVPVLAMDKIRG